MDRRKALLLLSGGVAAAVVLRGYWVNRWNYIVVHHSAGPQGDIPLLQRVHRNRQAGDPIDAIPYHYVIGNGKGLGLGEVANDWRGEYDIWGAHVSGNNRDHNYRGLGICLIGNFETEPMPKEQFEALVDLTRTLMDRYDIPPEKVVEHGKLQGESTLCPGKFFPYLEFRQAIRA